MGSLYVGSVVYAILLITSYNANIECSYSAQMGWHVFSFLFQTQPFHKKTK